MSDRTTNVLLVEEDPILMEITAFRLELLGYSVVSQSSGEAALQWMEKQLPDVVIASFVLPGMDGIELINRLSNDTRTSHVPTMLLSANGDLDDVQKAYNAGADDYLVIPYDPLVLESKVERLVTTGVTA